MQVEVAFTCAEGHEPVWFNTYHCPACEAREDGREHGLLVATGQVRITSDGRIAHEKRSQCAQCGATLMFIVRFPSGVSMTYNEATQLYYEDDRWVLYAGKKESGGKWIASVQESAGVVIEAVPACRIDAPPIPTPKEAITRAIELLPKMQGWSECRHVADVKTLLKKFDARRRCWKD